MSDIGEQKVDQHAPLPGDPRVTDLAGRRAIGDESFFVLVGRLKALRAFLSQAAIPLKPPANLSLSIGKIYALHFSKDGRAASDAEWDFVDSQIQDIYALLTPTHRQAFLATETPWLVPILALTLLTLGLVDIIVLVALNSLGWINPAILAGYVIFSTSLGALGALGSLSLNAILVQSDIRFDPSNTRLIAIRIVAGALFGCILNLPFGYDSFRSLIIEYNTFVDSINRPPPLSFSEASLLLLPFIFGYSTSAILMILDKLIHALETFMGEPEKRTSGGPKIGAGELRSTLIMKGGENP
jgi:hypothetical protein